MFWLKGCPKCGGDLHDEKDIHGFYVACLQCGRYLTHQQESALWPKRLEGFEKALAFAIDDEPVPSRSAA